MDVLTIQFGDQQSMRAALPQIAELVANANQRLEEANEEAAAAANKRRDAERSLEQWVGTYNLLQSMLDPEPSVEVPLPRELGLDELPDDPSSKEVALRVVTIINGPATVATVAEHMPDFSRKTVSWALWKLAEEGAIQKLKHGEYAPLGYTPGQPTTNYYEAARLGMPVPSAPQLRELTERDKRDLARATTITDGTEP
jgi:hypothetical protein